MTKTRTITELYRLQSFDERFEYLKLSGGVGRSTFGFDRHVNQTFYRSREWQDARQFVIYRDNGCDLGVPGFEIHVEILIHHINPMSVDDILHREDWIMDPEFLVATTRQTHNDIHFGVKRNHPRVVLERTPHDTRLW